MSNHGNHPNPFCPIVVTISACPWQPYPKRWAGLFEVRVDGRLVCPASRQPFLDAARVLIGEGGDPNAVAVMRHAGSAVEALKTKLGVAAKLTVDESTTRFRRWKAFSEGAKPWEGSRIIGLNGTEAPWALPTHQPTNHAAPTPPAAHGIGITGPAG